MKIISHRINTTKLLEKTSTSYGVEIDIRSRNKELILQHDPFMEGENFHVWLNSFNHKTLILNIKEEGLEDQIVQTLETYGIVDYFFLDQSVPFLIRKNNITKKKTAARYSEFESIRTVSNLVDYISWIWIDCFSTYPSNEIEKLNYFQSKGIKLCLVSPELQGHKTEEFIEKHYSLIKSYKIDAVCTKIPEFWEQFK